MDFQERFPKLWLKDTPWYRSLRKTFGIFAGLSILLRTSISRTTTQTTQTDHILVEVNISLSVCHATGKYSSNEILNPVPSSYYLFHALHFLESYKLSLKVFSQQHKGGAISTKATAW